MLRPALDALLIEQAVAAGADVHEATVVGVHLDGETARVEYDDSSGRGSVRAAYVLDCSGRAGGIARRGLRAHEPHNRMQALLGMWRCPSDSRFAAEDRIAVRHRQVPDAYESYCAAVGGVPLPAFLSVLSLLIAERVLDLR